MSNMIILYDKLPFTHKINTCLYGEISWIEFMFREKFRIDKHGKRKTCIEINGNYAGLYVDERGNKNYG